MAETPDTTLILHDKLVVGFDGSETSVAALRWAATEASRREASVVVLASFAPSPPVAYSSGLGHGGVAATTAAEELAQWARNELAGFVDDVFAAHSSVRHEYRAVVARPGTALTQAAEDADLVVVGRSGAGMLGRALLGSVTNDLLAHSPCPVVVVPDAPIPETGSVVVGTDGSAHATRAVRWAVDEADRREAILKIAHCWQGPLRLVTDDPDRSDDMSKVDAEIILDEAVETARELAGGDVDHRLVEGGTVDSMVELSRAADLVVLGSRGRGGFASMLLGSVAHAVASHAACPTVIVRG